MKRGALRGGAFLLAVLALGLAGLAVGQGGATAWAAESGEPRLSQATQACISCHRSITPGIVVDWESSRHASTTFEAAVRKPPIERRVSATEVVPKLSAVAVGCFECHGQNPEAHKDNFSHFGFRINVVVSPGDCSSCHPAEVRQYAGTKKAEAVGNLDKNPLYHTLVKTVIGLKSVGPDGTVEIKEPTANTRRETCFACHGTRVEVQGLKSVDTELGTIRLPDLTNWPNQGVGRVNPDGTRGACTACHSRHSFSIEMARKPHTCAQCHLEPDVPAWNVYEESKHGNIYFSMGHDWNYTEVPWRIGRDFKAPTCAVCHSSQIADPEGLSVMVPRTHDFGSRLWVRLFGLPYTHPQPIKGDTSIIRNADGQPLPTTFDGRPASEYLISEDEQASRKSRMKAVCRGCHNIDWVNGHFEKLETTIEETDKMTAEATALLGKAWSAGVADPSNPFDEEIEQLWVRQWLFYGNSARYASAMTGAPDYAAFKYGWWGLSTNLEKMREKLELKKKLK